MIVIMDTSVFCNVLDLPGRNQHRNEVLDRLEGFVLTDASLLLPLPVFYEAGNFIGQISDGRLRRQWAIKLQEVALEALQGDAPWTPTPFPNQEDFLELMQTFQVNATSGCGLVDHSLIKEWERLKKISGQRDVVIWSLDAHLMAYGNGAN